MEGKMSPREEWQRKWNIVVAPIVGALTHVVMELSGYTLTTMPSWPNPLATGIHMVMPNDHVAPVLRLLYISGDIKSLLI